MSGPHTLQGEDGEGAHFLSRFGIITAEQRGRRLRPASRSVPDDVAAFLRADPSGRPSQGASGRPRQQRICKIVFGSSKNMKFLIIGKRRKQHLSRDLEPSAG